MTVKRLHRLLMIGLAGALSATASAQNAVDLGVMRSTDQSTPHAANGRWFGDAERGWFWYEDPPATVEQPASVMPPVAALPADPLAELEALQVAVERSKALAVLHPTEPNIRAWMELNAAVQRRATLFADVTQRVVWSTPSLDQSLVRPHSQEGLKAWTAAKVESTSAALREIAQTYGLFFVFSSDCPYCRQIAPFLQRFAQTYDFTLIPISLDGGTLAEFPEARYEPTVKARLGVEITPAIFLVDPTAGHVQPIAYGVISISELETRIMRLFKMTPGQMTYNVYDAGGAQP
ncbi:MAG: conjugal transfer protein TraF [Woeseia sp.]